MANSNMVNSLLKALDIFKAVSEAENGLRLNELSEHFGMKKTTVHNLVRTLCARGFLIKDGCNRFQIGPAVSDIMLNQHRQKGVKKAAKVIRELYEAFPNATITFSELIGTEVHCRLRMSPDRPGLLEKPTARLFPPYNSAAGICFQAVNSSYYKDKASDSYFEEYAAHRWKSLEKFKAFLGEARNKGYVLLEDKERSEIKFAVPAGEYFALGVRFALADSAQIPEALKQTLKAAKAISENNGL